MGLLYFKMVREEAMGTKLHSEGNKAVEEWVTLKQVFPHTIMRHPNEKKRRNWQRSDISKNECGLYDLKSIAPRWTELP